MSTNTKVPPFFRPLLMEFVERRSGPPGRRVRFWKMGKAQEKLNDANEEVFVDELAPGTELMHGQYIIDSFLNAGGFGITYRAKDSLERKVVIKECFPGAFCRRSTAIVQARSRAHQNELASIVRLFVQEARSLAKLNHPNIVGVHQVFEENNTAYMALDYVEGRDLLDIIESPGSDLKASDIKSILRKVLDAVGFIHKQGILHRDISPDNILVDADMRPVLIDFGAAREEATKQSRVLSALRVVKDGYSPQEFYIAGSEQGPYSDLYALGASFYHLIADDVPPNSQARLASIASGDADPYEPLVGRFDEYDNDFLSAIDKSLEVLPKDRVASAEDWLKMMDGLALDSENVTPLNVRSNTTIIEPTAAAETKSKKGALLATAAVIALVAVGGLVATQTDLTGTPDVPAVETAAVEAPAIVDEPAEVVVEESTAAVEDATPDAASASAAIDAAIQEALNGQAAPASSEESTNAPAAEEVASIDAIALPVRPRIRPDDLAAAAQSEALAPAPSIVTTVDVDLVAPDVPDAILAYLLPLADKPNVVDAVAEVAAPIVTESDPTPAIDTVSAEITPRVSVEAETVEVSGLMSGWSVDLPVKGLFSGNEGESQIYAVNGRSVTSLAEFNDELRQTVDVAGLSEVDFSVLLGTSADNATVQNWSLPVIQETALLNGLLFRTTYEEDRWITRVAAVPEELSEDLQVGDIMYAFIDTTEVLSERRSMEKVLARQIEQERSDYSFAVMREGSTWVVSFSYTNPLEPAAE